ncbi:hypothetical protein P43SY_007906 [Pythium insidiosum]|uniref:Uncharacterized protein n=1 Tax=Pythium insidiosum TaxID=114742 RepID=A0AAD5M3X7_PYTIN|nr:hypothetical protein P43SY_007906 [Pythium insidiosum]
MYAQAQGIQKTVEKQKKDAQKKFSSWFFQKFTKSGNKTQYLRDQDERAVEAERLRKQKIASGKLDATSAAAATTAVAAAPFSPQGTALQRQKSFLRAQLLEMKRQSQEALLTAKQIRAERGSGSDADERAAKKDADDGDTSGDDADDDPDEAKPVEAVDDLDADPTDGHAPADEVPGNQQEGATRRRSSTAHSQGNQHDDGQRSRRSSVHSRMSENNVDHDGDEDAVRCSSGGKRNSISDELDRRLTSATMLYEEAIHALEEALQPEQQPSQPARGSLQIENRSRRAESASKKLFARPESEWI